MSAAVALDGEVLDQSQVVEDLVVENLALARSLAFEYLSRAPRHTDTDEVVSAALLGLVEAAHRFDPDRGVPFPAWATRRIRGAIVDAARQLDPLSRRTRASLRQLHDTEDQLAHQTGRHATDADLAGVGLNPATVARLRGELHRGIVLSLDQTLPDRPDTFAATLVDADPTPLESLERRELDAYLRDAVAELPDRLRQVVEGHYLRGLSNAEIGAELRVTPQRVSQLRAEALRLLRSGMTAQYPAEDAAPESAVTAVGKRTLSVQASYAAAVAARHTYVQRLSTTTL